MIVLIHANILAVGLGKKGRLLEKLPIRVISKPTGLQAARCLKHEKIDSVVSSWELEDMKDGDFVKGLHSIKPDMPTIVFIKPNQPQQEIAARSMGATAVLTDDASDELFTKTLANILGLRDTVLIKSVSDTENENAEQPGVLKVKKRVRTAN
jgi:DNA-binding NarL/FixJ family response regulator